MIVEKQYRVQLLDGKEITTLYETRQEAVRAHRGNINKLIEVLPRHTKPKVVAPTNDQLAIVISARSNEDLNISKDCGYAVMYNCPKMDKIYEGMKYLEKRTYPGPVMNGMLVWMGENQAEGADAAIEFLKTQEDVWTKWVSGSAAKKIKKAL